MIEEAKNNLLRVIENGIDGSEWEQIVIGLSDGKDSIAVAQLIIDVTIENHIDNPILFLSSDTMIENPLITNKYCS